MPRRARRAVLACALALLAAEARGQARVSLTRLPDKSFVVSGTFDAPSSTAAVWDVLTDYERIPSFVSSMRLSRVKESRRDGTVLVEQEAVGGMFLLSKRVRVLLSVRRDDGRLSFSDTALSDFRSYDGEWSVRATSSGVAVAYHLRAVPAFSAPGFVVRRAMSKGARQLLEQVRAEILRRTTAR